ncbi:MAG: DUF4124 domain-containing protein [Burkholderiales bacterium]
MVVLTLAVCLPFPAGAELYKWVDQDGKVHYSDAPPPNRKSNRIELKNNSISGPPVVPEIRSTPPVAAATAERVRLLTAAWCGYCKKARAYLQARGTPFEELDVETSAQGKSAYDALRGRGVPIILVGQQRMDGYDASALEAMLKNAGL